MSTRRLHALPIAHDEKKGAGRAPFSLRSGGRQSHVFHDIPFDAASGEVVVTPKIAHIRSMPAHRFRVRLVAVEAGGERVIGDYTFNHTPFAPRA
jgi:hypothetical protein